MTTAPSPGAYRGPALAGYDIDPPVSRIGMISMHTSPLADLGIGDAGGMNLYVRELARHLARCGAEIDVFTRRNNAHVPLEMADGQGVRIVTIDAGPASPLPKDELFALTGEFASNMLTYMKMRRRNYDVLHANYWLSGVVADLVRADTGIPFIQMFHTTAFHKNAVNEPLHREASIREVMETQLINAASAVIAANPSERDDLQDRRVIDDEMVCSIPLGVDTSMFVPGDKRDARRRAGLPLHGPLMLFVGRIDPIKGLDILLEAMRRTACHASGMALPRLVLVGGELDGDGVPTGGLGDVAATAKAMGIDDRIIFMGSTAQRNLVTLYQAVDFTVIPSRYESFGLVAVESMACGTPVIATRTGGLPYTVRDGVAGMLVPPANPVALTHAILELAGNPEHRDRLAAAARHEAGHFSWETVARSMMRVYDTVAHRAHAPICVA